MPVSVAESPSCPRQGELVRAIARHLARCGHDRLTVAQHDAVVEAADRLVAAFGRPAIPPKEDADLARWLASGDTCPASLAMARHLADAAGIAAPRVPGPRYPGYGAAYPTCAAEFARCMGLLDAVPGLAHHLDAMVGVSTVWSALADEWWTLAAIHLAEAPGGKTPRLDRRLAEIRERRGTTR